MAAPLRSATTGDGFRTYTWVTGETFPSVTTLLKNGMPKPALVAWGPKMVAEYTAENYETIGRILHPGGAKATAVTKKAAIDLLKGSPYRERDAAADIGSLIHDICEAHILGLPRPEHEERHEGFVRSFDAFLKEWGPEFVASEMTVYNRKYRWAGTLDFIARLPSLGIVLGDWKTTKPGRQGHGIYPEAALQLSAYRHAEFCGMPNGTEEPMPQVDACVAVNLRPNGYKVVPVDAGDLTYRQFLYVAQVAEVVENGARLVGDPLPPPETAVA